MHPAHILLIDPAHLPNRRHLTNSFDQHKLLCAHTSLVTYRAYHNPKTPTYLKIHIYICFIQRHTHINSHTQREERVLWCQLPISTSNDHKQVICLIDTKEYAGLESTIWFIPRIQSLNLKGLLIDLKSDPTKYQGVAYEGFDSPKRWAGKHIK